MKRLPSPALLPAIVLWLGAPALAAPQEAPATAAPAVRSPGTPGTLPVASKASLDDQKARPFVFADPDWFHWGGTPVLGDDGRYHLFYDRFPRGNGRLMSGWLYVSEIAHAIADRPEGPYAYHDTALAGPGDDPKGRWDAVNAHNAYCVRMPEPGTGKLRYYLYFIANRDNHETKDDWTNHIATQRIGVAVADKPEGPWTRQAEPACVPQAPLFGYTVNPGVTRLPDGRFLMLLKGRSRAAARGIAGNAIHGWALSDKPTGPFVIQKTLLFPGNLSAEDPCVFVQNGRIYAAVKDWHGDISGTPGIAWLHGELLADGSIRWEVPKKSNLSPRELRWSDGTSTKLHALERPFVLQDASGNPTHLFAAAAVENHGFRSSVTPKNPAPEIPGSHLPFNVCIPLLPQD